MKRSAAALVTIGVGLALSGCRPARLNMAPRPEPLGFPLMEESALPFEGTVSSPVMVRYGTAYFATEDGLIYCVDVLSRRIVWKFEAAGHVSAAPEVGEDWVVIRDEGNTIHVLDPDGREIFKTTPAGSITTAVRESQGRIYFGSGNGRFTALDIQKQGRPAWEYDAGAAVCSGPIFSGGLVIFGAVDGRVHALDGQGKSVWAFAGRGAVRIDPAAADGRVYFGTEDRYFYCLSVATGKKKWVFRLAGAPVLPAVPAGQRVILAASDSVIYCLRARSGEIGWWQPVPSRVVNGVAVADGIVLVSSFSPEVFGLDLRAGYRTGSFRAEGDIQQGAQWSTPYLAIVVPDPVTLGERLVFLKRDRRPVDALGKPVAVRR